MGKIRLIMVLTNMLIMPIMVVSMTTPKIQLVVAEVMPRMITEGVIMLILETILQIQNFPKTTKMHEKRSGEDVDDRPTHEMKITTTTQEMQNTIMLTKRLGVKDQTTTHIPMIIPTQTMSLRALVPTQMLTLRLTTT